MSELESPGEPTEKDLLQLMLTVQMRTYDVMLAILTKLQPEIAQQVETAHANFEVLGPLPYVLEE